MASPPPRVLAVVVTHNGGPWLEECLRSLALQEYPALDAVVVDNGSRASAELQARRLLPRAEFVRLERNTGFGAACNRALDLSRRAPGARFFLFLHDDVAVDPDCVRCLVEAASETEAGIVGGKGVSWEDPRVLVEVGMAADQFGYPFSGLEEGEIDQGQHDHRREVLFVTSACMLVSRAFVERCGSWDGAYFAFGEDLDLCLRARLSGFRVLFQPAARFRHAEAMATLRRDAEPTGAIRFYTRRNRSRTIAKNVAAYRMWAVLFSYTVLATAEMVMLGALRRFEEIPAYPRAFLSFFASLPDVVRRRRAVQKRRAIPDRGIRRYMVRDMHRARVHFERRLREWGTGTVEFGTRTFSRLSPQALKETLRGWVRRPSTTGTALVLLGVVVGARKVLFGLPVAAGGLWPYPADTNRLLTDFVQGWRDVGLGTSAAPPAALPFLWLVAALSLGKAALAQKVLVGLLLALGLAGVNRTVGRRTRDRAARVLAMAVYGLGPVVALVTGTGDLGALALYAGLPYILDIGQRMLGVTPGRDGDRPETPLKADEMSRDAARLALLAAAVVALAPSALVALAVLWLVAGVHALGAAWLWGERLRRAAWVFLGLGLVPVLLLPWSVEALRPRGPILAPLLAGLGGGAAYRDQWAGHSFGGMLLLDPGRRPLAALVAAAVALGVLALAAERRRRECRRLAAVWVFFALAGGLVAKGWLPAPVASAALWMIVPLLALSVLAAHLAASLREELPQHALGWKHAAAGIALTAVGAGIAASWIPALTSWGKPVSTLAGNTGDRLSGPLSSYLTSTAEEEGDFRVLWLGAGFVDPVTAGVVRGGEPPFLVTGPEGLTMVATGSAPEAAGERRLAELVQAVAARRLHLAGHLLAPASVRFIVVDPRDEELRLAMARQRDIALRQQDRTVAIFENLAWLPRATLAPGPLREAAGADALEARAVMQSEWERPAGLPRKGDGYRGPVESAEPGIVLLADNFNPGWRATLDGRRLPNEKAFGWSNRFRLPADSRGELRLRYTRDWMRILWVVLQAGLAAIALTMARSRTKELWGPLR